VDDFTRLGELGVNLTGKIALAKYGGPFRGLKVKNAQAAGMIGVVIFTDPGSDGPQERNGYVPYPSKISLVSSIVEIYTNQSRWASETSFVHSAWICSFYFYLCGW
jgi:hypothetical protein